MVLAYARRDHHDDVLDRATRKLARWVLDRVEGERGAALFENYFPKAPHHVTDAPINDELEEVSVLAKKLRAEAKGLDEGDELRSALIDHAGALETGSAALKEAQENLPMKAGDQSVLSGEGRLLRDDANRILDRTEGLLRAEWPGQRTRIRRFFDYITQRLRGRSRVIGDEEPAVEDSEAPNGDE